MDKSLFFQAIGKVLAGMVLVCVLIFLPAGTWHFPNGWLLLAALFIPMLIAGVVLMVKSPDLLQKRLRAKEPEPIQRRVIGASALVFVLGFVLAGLCFRFRRFLVPQWAVWVACAVFLFGYTLYGVVIAHNRWLARTVEIQPGQRLVDSGPYAVVRHPMYTAVLLMFPSMPLILGCWPALIPFLAFPFILVRRIQQEEQVLTAGLDGYADYTSRVRYRLLPFVW
ncbi:MAG: isoprenylcysteine carboxylmethyltransferase family protein [Oscillospiraceae bacterium]|nr:isoprenylcysteine carboxylmethyltransferase family protein [Oscillospiraceae bacterium]